MVKYNEFAGMVELVDSADLGSAAKSVQVRVLLPAPAKKPHLSTKTNVVFLNDVFRKRNVME